MIQFVVTIEEDRGDRIRLRCDTPGSRATLKEQAVGMEFKQAVKDFTLSGVKTQIVTDWQTPNDMQADQMPQSIERNVYWLAPTAIALTLIAILMTRPPRPNNALTRQPTNALSAAWNQGFDAGEHAIMFVARYALTNEVHGDAAFNLALSNVVRWRLFNPYLSNGAAINPQTPHNNHQD